MFTREETTSINKHIPQQKTPPPPKKKKKKKPTKKNNPQPPQNTKTPTKNKQNKNNPTKKNLKRNINKTKKINKLEFKNNNNIHTINPNPNQQTVANMIQARSRRTFLTHPFSSPTIVGDHVLRLSIGYSFAMTRVTYAT